MERTGKKFSLAEHTVLLLLHSPGISRSHNEPVKGKTRLMKLVFLLDKESRSSYPLIHVRNYVAHYYGPFNVQVSVALDRLLSYEYVTERVVTTSSDRELSIYTLSNRGTVTAENFWKDLPTDARRDIFSVKNAYNGMSMTKLLHYVYSSYPEYTTKSKLIGRELSYDA